MFKKVWIITWATNGGKLHDLTYNTQEEAEAWAERLMDREERDGKSREWIIRTAYVKV